MRLWVDDIRPAPFGWIWVTKPDTAIDLLKNNEVSEISLDHDLGGDCTSYAIACFIEESAHDGTLKRLKWDIHSANPVGRARLQATLNSAEFYWKHGQQAARHA